MLDKNRISTGLRYGLGKNPDAAERFKIEKYDVDILQFNDRPYVGAVAVITNGASKFFSGNPFEFVLIYEPDSLKHPIDVKALVATYLQLHFIKNHDKIKIGEYFNVSGVLMRGHDFSGIYTTRPVYFDPQSFAEITGIEFFWLVPIFSDEYDFIDHHGADAFESCLVDLDPNLARFDRSPIKCLC